MVDGASGHRPEPSANWDEVALSTKVASAVGRLAASRRFRSACGIERFDRLAIEFPEEFARFVGQVRQNGWIVKESRLLSENTPAYFFPRKGRFYYDPDRLTYLDMLHEMVHLESFAKRGNWKLGKDNRLAAEDEIAAYSRELALLQHVGGANAKYLEYLEQQIAYYRQLPEALKNLRGGS